MDGGAILGVLGVAVVGALAFFGVGRVRNDSSAATQASPPSPIDVPVTTPTITFDPLVATPVTGAARVTGEIDTESLTPFTPTGVPGTNRQLPRGIRNNNPGNIESGRDQWQGAVGDDGRYLIFESPEYGIRALAKILLNYERLHGLNTVQGIINRWAPPFENNTVAYVDAVAAKLGVGKGEVINVREELSALVPAIIRHENGQQPYTMSQIITGISLA